MTNESTKPENADAVGGSPLQAVVIWRPIEEAPKGGDPLWLYSPDFVDEDFNPTGVVDGFWNDDYGWTIWRWNGSQDCYDTMAMVGPTHFARKVAPAI